MRPFFSALLAYISSRILFAIFDFNHWSIGESFDLGKLVVDLIVYAVLFWLFYYFLGRIRKSPR